MRPSTRRPRCWGCPIPAAPRSRSWPSAAASGRFSFPRPMLDRPGLGLQFQWPEDRRPSSLAGPRIGRADAGRRRARIPGGGGRHAGREMRGARSPSPGIGALVVAGGVGANRRLRQRLKDIARRRRSTVVFPAGGVLHGQWRHDRAWRGACACGQGRAREHTLAFGARADWELGDL